MKLLFKSGLFSLMLGLVIIGLVYLQSPSPKKPFTMPKAMAEPAVKTPSKDGGKNKDGNKPVKGKSVSDQNKGGKKGEENKIAEKKTSKKTKKKTKNITIASKKHPKKQNKNILNSLKKYPGGSPYRKGGGYQAKFASLQALNKLYSNGYLRVLAEYVGDDYRYFLPRRFAYNEDFIAQAQPVSEKIFDSYLSNKKVLVLDMTIEDDAKLRQMLKIFNPNVRFLTILGDKIVDGIRKSATGFSAEKSIFLIEESDGEPIVKVALHRK